MKRAGLLQLSPFFLPTTPQAMSELMTMKMKQDLNQVQLNNGLMRDVKKGEKITVTKDQYKLYLNMYPSHFEGQNTEGDGIYTKQVFFIKVKEREFMLHDADGVMRKRRIGEVVKVDKVTYHSLVASYKDIFDFNIDKEAYLSQQK